MFELAVTLSVQLLQLQEVHPGTHSQCLLFLSFLSIPVLSWTSFTSRTLFPLIQAHNPEASMNYTVNAFVHAILQALKEVACFCLLGLIPMTIQ